MTRYTTGSAPCRKGDKVIALKQQISLFSILHVERYSKPALTDEVMLPSGVMKLSQVFLCEHVRASCLQQSASAHRLSGFRLIVAAPHVLWKLCAHFKRLPWALNIGVCHEVPISLFVALFVALDLCARNVIRSFDCPRHRHGSHGCDSKLATECFQWSVIDRSCIVRPCHLVRHCQVLNCQVRHFQRPIYTPCSRVSFEWMWSWVT